MLAESAMGAAPAAAVRVEMLAVAEAAEAEAEAMAVFAIDPAEVSTYDELRLTSFRAAAVLTTRYIFIKSCS